MQKQQKNIVTIIIAFLIMFGGVAIYLASVDPFTITEASFETNLGELIEPSAQRLSFQLDANENRHFIYQLGEPPIVEPDAIPYNGSHILKYGSIVDDVFEVETVTDDLVFPYHYEFQVDSIGRIHIAYIANNYTLYYAVRDPDTGKWDRTQLNTPSEMWAMMPGITLGTNEQPRIVYSVRFKEDGNVFFNQEGEVINLSSLFYAVLNGSSWLYYDVGDNHSGSTFSQRDLQLQRIYNPAIKIENGFAYIAFTNKVSLAVETRMQYIKIPEIPEDITFRPLIHQRAKIAASQASTFRRPNINLIGDGILIAFGAWTFGAGSIIYLTNASELQDPNPAFAPNQWLKESLLPLTKLNKQLESVLGVRNQNGTIFLTWSLYDLFNAQTLQFSHDVFLTSFSPTSNSIGAIHTVRVTDTTQVHHYTPGIALLDDNTIEIQYIQEEVDGTFLLKSSIFSGIGNAFENEGLALIVSLGFVGTFVVGIIAAIQLLPRPEEEVVILPHMINLKDVITKD